MSDSLLLESPQTRSASEASPVSTPEAMNSPTLATCAGDNSGQSPRNGGETRRDSQSYEPLAFKSQFEEVNQAVARFLENSAKTHSNRYNGFSTRAANAPSFGLAPQRRMGESMYTHARSNSYSATPRQHVLKHRRSASSLSNQSVNGSYYSPRSAIMKLPSIDGYDIFTQDTDEFLNYMDEKNGLRDVDIGTSRFGFTHDPDWDAHSNSHSSTPGISISPFGYSPFTPTSLSSSYSSANHYFVQSHSLLDDDGLAQKQMQLETNRKLLQIQQRQLDNAIYEHNMNLINGSTMPAANDSGNRLPLTPPTSSYANLINVPTKDKTVPSLRKKSSLKNLSVGPRLLSLEPIGTPNRKSGSSSPASLSGSNPSPTSGFSLFAQSPTMSLNQNMVSRKNPSHGFDVSFDTYTPFGSFPLTPASTPPNEDPFASHNPPHADHVHQASAMYSRGESLFSPLVPEDDEECLWNDGASFDSFEQKFSSSNPIDNDWDRYHERMAAMNRKRHEREVSNPEIFARRSRLLSHSSNGTTLAAAIARRASESQLYRLSETLVDENTTANRFDLGGSTHRGKDNNQILSQILDEGFGNDGQEKHQQAHENDSRHHQFTEGDKTSANSYDGFSSITEPERYRFLNGLTIKKQQVGAYPTIALKQSSGDFDNQFQDVKDKLMNMTIKEQQHPATFDFRYLHHDRHNAALDSPALGMEVV